MELMRFYSDSYKSDFSVIYIDGSEVTVIVGLDEDYSSRIYDNMTSPIDTLIDELKDLGVSEIIFIDDSFKNCKELLDIGIKTYIFDTRINESLEYEKLERVYSWPHLYQEIEKIKNKR